ncbi:hypothetical protein POM88_033581 [Heracleum sosnowskyi]|uniref:RING-type domain-containing protein n=1 Tax=Heracleum sosnowskyi TaxID=360622 RepID=A0AAD8MMK4_9APIA|nr:hypothetical protein POM88_033581 [Heracleum sosnowskyi]
MSPQARMDASWIMSLQHTQICEFNVVVAESDGIVKELAPGDSEVIGLFSKECSISSIWFRFPDLRSITRKGYHWCERQVLESQPHMRPATLRILVRKILEYGEKLVSLHGSDDVNFGYVVDARLDVEDFRVCRQFDDLDDVIEDYYDSNENEDDISEDYYDSNENKDYICEDDVSEDDISEDDEENPRFRGVEKGRCYGKQVITCSVCLEDLRPWMKFKKLPCSHIFHPTCIDHWLKEKTSCPNCRTQLTRLVY